MPPLSRTTDLGLVPANTTPLCWVYEYVMTQQAELLPGMGKITAATIIARMGYEEELAETRFYRKER